MVRYDEMACGGVRLRTAVADPAGEAVACVVLLPGRTEFIEKYLEVITRLTDAGCRVFTLDWRGQGRSSRLLVNPHKGHVDSYEEFLEDLDRFLERVVDPHRRGPLVLLGHSMGGHIGLRHLYRSPGRFDGAIFSAPMWDLPFDGPLRLAGGLLAGCASLVGAGGCYAPGMGDYDPGRQPFEGNPLTSDRQRYRRMHDLIAADPGLALGGVTVGWLSASLASIAILRGLVYAEPIDLPILVLCGERDRIVDVPIQRAFCERLPRAEYVGYSEGRHEVLQETDDIFEDALARILAFVERLRSGAAAAAAQTAST